MDGLKLEKVSDTLSIYQKHGVFCYGTDAVLLAKNVLAHYKTFNNKKMCDLCSGTGIIPLMLCDAAKGLYAHGVEINSDAATLSSKSAAESGLSERCVFTCHDIKEIKNLFSSESFDFVTCNPPYMTATSGKMCDHDYKSIARHEILCNIDDVFKAAFYLLKTGGNIFVVYRSDRLASLFCAAEKNRFQIKEMYSYVSENMPSLSKLTIIRAAKDAKEGLKHFVLNTNQILQFNGVNL